MRRLMMAALCVIAAAACADPIVPSAYGKIAGVITGPDVEGNSTPIPGVTVIVSTTGPGITGVIVATRLSDDAGRYAVDSVPIGSYGVGANPPAIYAFTSGNAFVTVPGGGTATADFFLTRAP